MLSTIIALVLAAGSPKIGRCDPADGPPIRWSAEERDEVRARARATCKAQGAARGVCAWLDASGVRESSWSPSVRHTMGVNEAGLGIFGLSKRWHRDKWPGAVEPAFCSPEPSVLVALAIVRRAQVSWGARDLRDVQAVFAGRFACMTDLGRRECFIERNAAADRDVCERLKIRGVDCRAPLPKNAAGRRVKVRDRPARAEALAARFTARE